MGEHEERGEATWKALITDKGILYVGCSHCKGAIPVETALDYLWDRSEIRYCPFCGYKMTEDIEQITRISKHIRGRRIEGQ
ncbi:MAG: hypothetical protein IJS22_03390 [Lachnospiraceae bacterium]|nr:hypothetical protein [Lachnospiraceae bacterium]